MNWHWFTIGVIIGIIIINILLATTYLYVVKTLDAQRRQMVSVLRIMVSLFGGFDSPTMNTSIRMAINNLEKELR